MAEGWADTPDAAEALLAQMKQELGIAGEEAKAFEAHLANERHGSVRLRVRVATMRTRDGRTAPGFVVTGQQNELSLLELEDRLTRAEQLLNVGELATGVAHELKNPLTSILNYADYLLRKYQGSFFEDRDSERLRRIIEGVERIDNFVRDLVVLARPVETDMQRIELHAVIRESGLMCDVALRQSAATLHVDLDPRPPAVIGSPHQLKQVFVNLLVNAAKAMPQGGGTITVATRIHAGAVSCHVTDDAEGMSDETLARIFEPFFTTREGRDGSGLGLALVRTIVRRHGGEVTVDSELGRGTTFTIRLPLAGE